MQYLGHVMLVKPYVVKTIEFPGSSVFQDSLTHPVNMISLGDR